ELAIAHKRDVALQPRGIQCKHYSGCRAGHAGSTLWPHPAYDENMSRLYLATRNRLHRLLPVVVNNRRTAELVAAAGAAEAKLYDRALRCKGSLENAYRGLVGVGPADGTDHFRIGDGETGEIVLQGATRNRQRVGAQQGLELLQQGACAASGIELLDGVISIG